MTDQNPSERTRRTFMKGAAATGVAATGVTAFSGSAAGQQNDVFDIEDVTATQDQDGLVNVAIQLSNVQVDAIDQLRIRIRDVVVVRDVLQDFDDLIEITLEDINVQALNNLNVVVQALTSGSVVETERQRANLQD